MDVFSFFIVYSLMPKSGGKIESLYKAKQLKSSLFLHLIYMQNSKTTQNDPMPKMASGSKMEDQSSKTGSMKTPSSSAATEPKDMKKMDDKKNA